MFIWVLLLVGVFGEVIRLKWLFVLRWILFLVKCLMWIFGFGRLVRMFIFMFICCVVVCMLVVCLVWLDGLL